MLPSNLLSLTWKASETVEEQGDRSSHHRCCRHHPLPNHQPPPPSIFDSNKVRPLLLAVTLSYKGTFLPWGNAATSDTPAPTHPRRVVRNPLKRGAGGGEGDAGSRANEDGGSCCIHIVYDTWEQKLVRWRGGEEKMKSEKVKVWRGITESSLKRQQVVAGEGAATEGQREIYGELTGGGPASVTREGL